MAPTSNTAKGLQQNRVRPVVPRTVIPAIPLPFVQKRQKQQEAATALARAKEVVVQTTTSEPIAAQSEQNTSPKSPPNDENAILANGSSNMSPVQTQNVASAALPAMPATPAESGVGESDRPDEDAQEHKDSTSHTDTAEAQEVPISIRSDGQSEASKSTYHMPPPFVPAGYPDTTIVTQGDSPKFAPPHMSFNGQHHIHHAHPSNGSLMFGGYPESNNSSPAPPPSAGNMPPYPPFSLQHHQHGAGRHAPHLSNGAHPQAIPNGYSPMGPPPGYFQRQEGFGNQVVMAEFGRRQHLPGNLSFGNHEGYSPSATPVGFDARVNSYDPSTPHSLPGSQSSAPVENENGPAFYSHYPTAVISNGTNGHVDEVRLYQQPRPKPRTGSQPMLQAANFSNHANGQPPLPMDHLDGLVSYLQSQFADPSFADYTLELRYSDDRAPPVRIPGHNIMLARSPTLKSIMLRQAHNDGLMVRTLLIESDDRFLRSDGFWMAVQRLYGGPLLDMGVLTSINPSPNAQSPSPMPGTPADRFQLALGYAAAGQILQIPPVVSRGIEIASHFINWNTVEKGLEFALDGGLDSQWTGQNEQVQEQTSSTYGPAVNMLIHSALSFAITSFPAGFRLDTSVEHSPRNPRLPPIPESRPTGHNHRLSFIKFGDHPSEDTSKSSSANYITTVLSRILLNLPFHLLKYVLESSRLGNVQGWATTVLRQEVMHAVVEERERRRVKIHSSSVSNHERKTLSRDWDAVGWKESVQLLDGNEAAPTLSRTWGGFTKDDSNGEI